MKNGRRKTEIQAQNERERVGVVHKKEKNAGFKYISVGFGGTKCFHNADWEKEVIKIVRLFLLIGY